MREIELSQGQVAIVDDKDYNKLNQYKWYASYQPSIESYYAARNTPMKNGKRKMIYMHRIIMNAPSNMQTDHTNHDTLDNRKQNLRICTHRQNGMNRTQHKNTFLSKYKGVYLQEGKYWHAYITVNQKRAYLGLFKSEINAAKAYNKAARGHFGNFALLNNIKEVEENV